jgi:hypothetical protein
MAKIEQPQQYGRLKHPPGAQRLSYQGHRLLSADLESKHIVCIHTYIFPSSLFSNQQYRLRLMLKQRTLGGVSVILIEQ